MTSAGEHALRGAVIAAATVAAALAGLRWLRVAQREHYLPDAASRFAVRWWIGVPANLAGLVVAVAGLLLATRVPAAALATAVVVALGPLGLGLRGRSAPLAWTRRLRTLAGVWAVVVVAGVAGGTVAGAGPLAAAAAALATPALVDLAGLVLSPVERRLGRSYVVRARERLRRVGPTVVAITGSYGKTSTKGYVAHLLGGSFSVVASPASFNNRAGLARAVNEHLAEGTEVFVAEMGTYGPGEIAELCSWVRPDVSVITAIGPVHLERFGSEERIVRAKAEILAGASSVVLVVDDPRLAALAEACGPEVALWRVSGTAPGPGPEGGAGPDPDVRVVEEAGGLTVSVGGDELARAVEVDARPGNVAAAVAVALQLGVERAEVARRLATLPTAPHRLQPGTAQGGVVVLDDTYNANPAGGRAALAALGRLGSEARHRVLVTPGMVELGRRQAEENTRLAREAGAVATEVVVVGRTNRRALVRGADGVPVVLVRTRDQARAWVRAHTGPGDVVLYENDLPDHYP
ncbi:MAG TPA: UDP-N-acetylmuramoyl-tripeptide--D-alanyl-D-alanine ligase [Acidimicrobiales bacterium]|nr:UDP-N-acetylmuramoyl-tripeptide--D-alanyl-D-alanine ligase [Acidimicrobiales bacterium]